MSSWTRNHWQNAEAIELSPDGRFGAFQSAARAPHDLQSQSIILDQGPQFAGDDIADNTSTTTTIAAGQSISSSIQTNGDLDYFRITLTAGQTYTFSLAGLSDAYVELRDASGALVAENDDGGINLNSFLMYRAATSGTFYVVARHYTPVPDQFNPTVTGNYTLSVNSITQGETSPTTFPSNSLPHFSWDEAAIQISRSGYSWAQSFGTSATVTYSYRSTAPGTMPDDTAGFSRFSAAQITAAEAALAAWAAVANITFVRVNDGDGYSNSAAIVFGNYSTGSAGAAAFAYNPSSGDQTVGSAQGDVWINSSLSYNANPVVGEYGQQVLLHEIGHALGLNHPADYNASNGVSIEYGTHATYYADSRMFTSMSYFSASNTGGITSLYASLPELHDIAAIQRLYGANITTRTGDTIYGFNSNTGLPEYVIALATEAAIFTVWDGGGLDTLDFSGYSTNNVIDLRAESFSNVGPSSNAGTGLAIFNISIARGVVIENAIGGSGSDTIIGNNVANILNGGGGADTMSGGGGNDTYIVDSTSDIVIEELNAGTDFVQASASFTLSANVENLLLTGTIQLNGAGNALNNSITGNSNANALAGLAGNDTLYGLGGDDELNGGDGDDILDGGLGADTASGGDGNDTVLWDAADGFVGATGGAGLDTLVFSNVSAPTSFNLVAQGFEGAEGRFNDTGSNPWDTRVDLYDSLWRLDISTTINDNGTRESTDFDQANAVGWSNFLTRQDALLRTTETVLTYDDGSRDATNFDVTNSVFWSSFVTRTDALSRTTETLLIHDDGTRDTTNFDADNSQFWTSFVTRRDALGRQTESLLIHDDGVRDTTNYDADNSQFWTSFVTRRDALGNTTESLLIHDDGTRDTTNYDADNSQFWTSFVTRRDALGRQTESLLIHDDGTRDTTNFDPENNVFWSSFVTRRDSLNRTTDTLLIYDDGRRDSTDYDEANAFNWSHVVYRYDSSGTLYQTITTYDDGHIVTI